MVKFSPRALNFGFDIVLKLHFLGYPVLYTKHNVRTAHYAVYSGGVVDHQHD